MSFPDFAALGPLSPEIITNQSTINIGTIGHVAHGKTTLVKAISGVLTIRSAEERQKNKTVRLGYANAKIYECPSCPPPRRYQSSSSKIDPHPLCKHCQTEMALIRHISFVDCPGHDILMATMLTGTAVMDAALLVIAANEPFPRPQTREHFAAVQIVNLRHLLIIQNKVDLVSQAQAIDQHEAILSFVANTSAEGAPVIPISAQLHRGIDYALEGIVKTIPVPMRDYGVPPRMIVVRSFDVNKPGRDVRELEGGVAGGSILEGCLHVGQEVEIRPGMSRKTADGKAAVFIPYRARIVSLQAEENRLAFAVPGGLIGVGLTLGPSICRHDRLVSQVIGLPGQMPDAYYQLTVHVTLFDSLIGAQTANQIEPLKVKEMLLVNIGSKSVSGQVLGVHVDVSRGASPVTYAIVQLQNPACGAVGERIALSRKMGESWRLIGWATVLDGKKVRFLEA